MIFNCGETLEAKKTRLSNWHPFFALWPRTVGTFNGREQCAWLQTIQRKGTIMRSWDDVSFIWEYKLGDQT